MKESVRSMFLTLVAIVCGMTLFTSCEKDEAALIIGTWEVVDGSTTVVIGDVNVTSPLLEEGDSNVITFNEDGTWSATEVSKKHGTEKSNGTYLLIDDQLTFIENGLQTVMHVDELTKKSMTLSQKASGVEDGVNYSGSVVMKLKKK